MADERTAGDRDRDKHILDLIARADNGDGGAKRLLETYRQDSPSNHSHVTELVAQFRRQQRMP